MFLTAAALATSTLEDRWVRIDASPDGYEEYLDKESITPSGDKVTLWTRRDSVQDQSILWHELELECSTRLVTTLTFVRDVKGSISHSFVRPFIEASKIPPNSAKGRVFALVCDPSRSR